MMALLAGSLLLAGCGGSSVPKSATGIGVNGTPTDSASASASAQASASKHPGAALNSWFKSVQPLYTAWSSDIASLTAAGKASNVAALTTGCQHLQGDVSAFQRKLPTPDATSTTELTAAVQAAMTAAQLCAGQKFDAMSTQFGVMNAHLTAATERIKTVTSTS